MDCDVVLSELGSTPEGLSTGEAGRRLAEVGPNALRSHGARPLAVLARQFKNPLLILLIGTALVSAFVGESTNAIIILSIVGLSVGWGSSTSTAPNAPWRSCTPSSGTPRSWCATASPPPST